MVVRKVIWICHVVETGTGAGGSYLSPTPHFKNCCCTSDYSVYLCNFVMFSTVFVRYIVNYNHLYYIDRIFIKSLKQYFNGNMSNVCSNRMQPQMLTYVLYFRII